MEFLFGFDPTSVFKHKDIVFDFVIKVEFSVHLLDSASFELTTSTENFNSSSLVYYSASTLRSTWKLCVCGVDVS